MKDQLELITKTLDKVEVVHEPSQENRDDKEKNGELEDISVENHTYNHNIGNPHTAYSSLAMLGSAIVEICGVYAGSPQIIGAASLALIASSAYFLFNYEMPNSD